MDYSGTSYNGRNDCVPLDLTEKFESQPTSAQLVSMATSVMNSKQPNLPSQNIKVDFIRLQDSPEYEQFSSLLQCNLCDTVHVEFPRYNMQGDFKIVRVVYDSLAERYIEMELGALSTSLAEALGITNTPNPDRINENFYVDSDGNITSNGSIDIAGYYTGLYKITFEAVSVGAINAHSYESAAAHAMTAQAGYHAVSIAGWATSNFRIRPTTHRVDSDTELFAGFANTSASNVTAGTTVTFRVLWLKATSA